jgi:hypothetical protein
MWLQTPALPALAQTLLCLSAHKNHRELTARSTGHGAEFILSFHMNAATNLKTA